MTDLSTYCRYLYNSFYIPVYIYEDMELICYYPSQELFTLPPKVYLASLRDNMQKVSYTHTSFHSYYGYIEIKNSSSYIVIGPINDFPYSRDSLEFMVKEYSVGSMNADQFAEFFHKIPQQNLNTFINILLLIHYTINQEEFPRSALDKYIGQQTDSSIIQRYNEISFQEKEHGLVNNNWSKESELFRYIEMGNVAKLNYFLNSPNHVRIGIVANNNLRQWKNTFIVTVTLASRAAIKGGLSPSIAYQLSDIYIQQVERLSDTDAIISLTFQALNDYTNKAANSVLPPDADQVLHQAVQFIRENTHKLISVSDVAAHVGFSRSYLSRRVKKELGFELSTFIKQCKLEEAKDLLLFTNKSISEISNDLCFSSQSHFQKAFKDHYSVTPNSFRKSRA